MTVVLTGEAAQVTAFRFQVLQNELELLRWEREELERRIDELTLKLRQQRATLSAHGLRSP